jgi:glycosyltransferase involved in cell wall biosynthesis
MDKRPLISVIVPIYNVESYLEECVNSLLKQSYLNLEIILVNDGATDNSPNICDFYQKQDERIHVIHKSNGGLSDARNKGIDASNGEYLIFVDSDDKVHIDFISTLYSTLISADAQLAICMLFPFKDSIEIPDITLNSQQIVYSKTEVFNSFYRYDLSPNFVVAWNKIYHKSLFKSLRYPLGKKHEDEFVIHHIYYQCKKIVLNYSKLYYYRQREGSIMTQQSEQGFFDILEMVDDRIDFAKKNNLKNFRFLSKLKKAGVIISANLIYKSNPKFRNLLFSNFFIVCFYLFTRDKFNFKERFYRFYKLFLT